LFFLLQVKEANLKADPRLCFSLIGDPPHLGRFLGLLSYSGVVSLVPLNYYKSVILATTD
jgi:hypothetical protein